MLRIPYIPAAYPDETFGSLLIRLVLYNGTGLWRSLLEESGYGRRTTSTFFAIPDKDARLDRLLAELGYCYQDMLQQLTILPFWLAFNNASRLRQQIVIPSDNGSGTRLLLVGKPAFNAGAHYCPGCIADDFSDFGEPYVHRHHQLPVALVCAKHGEWLRFTCKTCGITVLPFTKTLLPPLTLRCKCGQDLTARSKPLSSQGQSLQRLSQFGQDTLSCTSAPWTQYQVREFLKNKMNLGQKDFQHKALKLLESTYGPMEKNSSGLKLSLKLIDVQQVILKLNVPIELQRAPEFCSLLSAIGLTFEEFKSAIATFPSASPYSKPPKPQPPQLTIEWARLEFNRFASEASKITMKKLQFYSPKLYWFLRLKDNSWLELRLQKSTRAIPSIEKDRAKISTIFSQPLKERNRIINNNKSSSGLWIRASIRDATWLQSQLKEWQTNEKIARKNSGTIQYDRAVALSRAIFSALRLERRPVRIHAGLLSKFVSISMRQAQQTIANYTYLRYLINVINAGKDRRMAMWAARTLADAGEHLTPNDVLLRAGLNTTKVNRQFAISAIAAIGKPNQDQL